MFRSYLIFISVLFVFGCASEQSPGFSGDKADSLGPTVVGAELTDQERALILDLLDGDTMSQPDEPVSPYFILHDTAGATSSSWMRGQVEEGRGPLGLGPAAYINKEDTFFARPFFYRWRPSSTLFEQGADILQRKTLNDIGRRLWKAVADADREEALSQVLSPVHMSKLGPDGLTDSEIESQRNKARNQFESSSGHLYTTALWTLEILVENRLGFDGITTDEGESLIEYFAIRNDRVERSINLEIGQISGDNACNNRGSLPAYTDSVYEQSAKLYLHSALVAGVYPEMTTHFAIDSDFHGSHCDPRCFDLGRLYREISVMLGRDEETLYGIAPSYGTQHGSAAIWWNDSVCGRAAPGQ